MKVVSFQVNGALPQADEVRARIVARAAEHGIRDVDVGSAEAVVVLGGDGSLLRAVHHFPDLPVLGLNLGGLGYLASVEERDFGTAMQRLAEGRYGVSERRMLAANDRFVALNDIVITRTMSGHSTRLDLTADGKFVTRYMADGLVFSTPTGSTAYSLAAGGPVLMPHTDCVVVTPMNPHALGVRPLVTRDSVRFVVTARPRTPGNEMRVGVYADGENVLMLNEGETVEIARANQVAKLIELEGYDPYDVLARKLGWSGSNVS